MSMPTNWVVPIAANLNKVLDQKTLMAAEANTGATDSPNAPVDQDGELRSEDQVTLVVNRIRGAIATGNRIAVSLTPLSIPPEAEQYCLVIVGWQMLASTGNLSMVTAGPHGNLNPFYEMYKRAEKWIDMVQSGDISPTAPNDPTPSGVVGFDGNVVEPGVNWGDLYGSAGQYEAGTQKGAAPFDLTTDA